MSHFYGTVQGAGAVSASRAGTKNSGMETHCASQSGAVRCYAYTNALGVNHVRVEKVEWKGNGKYKLLYDGPMG